MTWMIDQTILVWTLSGLVLLSIPLILLSHYLFRLRLRKDFLRSEIHHLHLEGEYLKLFHFEAWWSKPEEKWTGEQVQAMFDAEFEKRFRGDNSLKNFVVPMLLTIASTFAFSSTIHIALTQYFSGTISNDRAMGVFAAAGAYLYVFTLYVIAFASLSLNPRTQFSLLGKLWLSFFLGVLLAGIMTPTLQPAAAFLGSLLPLETLAALRKRLFNSKEEEPERVTAMLKILNHDKNLLSQLEYLGIRTIAQLAYEKPIRIFVETDLNLTTCIDLVDQANLHLYVPSDAIRTELNKTGIRTAIDLMTQVYDQLPGEGGNEWRFLRADEPLPEHFKQPLLYITEVMQLKDIGVSRNLIQMMAGNPQLRYIFNLWNMLNETVDKSTVPIPTGPETSPYWKAGATPSKK